MSWDEERFETTRNFNCLLKSFEIQCSSDGRFLLSLQNLLRWRHKMQIPLLITWFLDRFTKVHFARVSLEYHIWAFTYHEVFIHLNSQFYVNRKDPQWQWKQIVSQPSFHSINFPLTREFFSLANSFPCWFSSWNALLHGLTLEEIFGNWG